MACQPTTSQLHCCFTNLSDFKCINLLEGTIQASYSILVSQAAEVFIHRRQSGYNNIYFKFISTNRLFKLLRCCILFLRKFLMDFPNGFHWERVAWAFDLACVHLTWSGLSMSTRLPCQCWWVSGLGGFGVLCKFEPRSKVNNGGQQRKKGQAISVTAGRPTARHLLKLVQQKWMAGVLPMDW